MRETVGCVGKLQDFSCTRNGGLNTKLVVLENPDLEKVSSNPRKRGIGRLLQMTLQTSEGVFVVKNMSLIKDLIFQPTLSILRQPHRYSSARLKRWEEQYYYGGRIRH